MLSEFPPLAAQAIANTSNVAVLLGGVAFKVGDEVIGGIGVGGSPEGDKDEACAKAGVAKVRDLLRIERRVISQLAGCLVGNKRPPGIALAFDARRCLRKTWRSSESCLTRRSSISRSRGCRTRSEQISPASNRSSIYMRSPLRAFCSRVAPSRTNSPCRGSSCLCMASGCIRSRACLRLRRGRPVPERKEPDHLHACRQPIEIKVGLRPERQLLVRWCRPPEEVRTPFARFVVWDHSSGSKCGLKGTSSCGATSRRKAVAAKPR
jgi:hypothetical protein